MRRKVINVKSNAKAKIIILIALGILFALLPLITVNLSFITGNSNKGLEYSDDINIDNKNPKISKVSEKITIDGNSDWVSAKTAGICTGDGTFSDPYVIKDLEINSESGGTCFQIRNSNVYFRVENCTFYNSGEAFQFSGIKLQSVSNGILINNTLSENNHGMIVSYGYNLTITGNNVKNNVIDGIFLQFSDNNNVSNNIINNSIYGIHLDRSDNNTINNNGIINNNVGIILEAGSCNQILLNTFSGNTEDIRDNQDVCSPESPPDVPIVLPFPIQTVIISIFFIVPAIVVGWLIVKKRSSRTAVRKYKAQKEPVKQKLVVSYDIKDKVIEVAPQIEAAKDTGPEELVTLSGPEERISKEKDDVQEIKAEDQEVLEPLEESISKEKDDVQEIKAEDQEVLKPLNDIIEQETTIVKKAREETISLLKPSLPAVEQSPSKSESLKLIPKESFSTPISSTKSIVEQTPIKEESSKQLIKETIPPEVIERIEEPIPLKTESPRPGIIRCAFCGMEVDAERNLCQRCGYKLKKS